MNCLLQDVNLALIEISQDGRNITLDFVNMADGGAHAKLEAQAVVLFNYQNAFEAGEDALPAFVAEVTCEEFDNHGRSSQLMKLGYGFLGRGVETYVPKLNNCFVIHVEGGEVSLDLLCGAYQLTKQQTNH
jgi:hypothetical protein